MVVGLRFRVFGVFRGQSDCMDSAQPAMLFFNRAAQVALVGMHPASRVHQPLEPFAFGDLEIFGRERLSRELALHFAPPMASSARLGFYQIGNVGLDEAGRSPINYGHVFVGIHAGICAGRCGVELSLDPHARDGNDRKGCDK